MIITLQDALKIDSSITQDVLDSYEIAIRELTHNHFHVLATRISIKSLSDDEVELTSPVKGVRVGDTVELTGTQYNNGLYVVQSIVGSIVTVDDELYTERPHGGNCTKVSYPADIVQGVKNLLNYELKMRDNIGVKSRTISRWSETYYDVNSSETVEGYPASLFAFIKKYRKLRF